VALPLLKARSDTKPVGAEQGASAAA
jgi:hypothetical protein